MVSIPARIRPKHVPDILSPQRTPGSGGSRICEMGRGHEPKMWGTNLLFWPIFLENYMKMKKTGALTLPWIRHCHSIKSKFLCIHFTDIIKVKQQRAPNNRNHFCTFLLIESRTQSIRVPTFPDWQNSMIFPGFSKKFQVYFLNILMWPPITFGSMFT